VVTWTRLSVTYYVHCLSCCCPGRSFSIWKWKKSLPFFYVIKAAHSCQPVLRERTILRMRPIRFAPPASSHIFGHRWLCRCCITYISSLRTDTRVSGVHFRSTPPTCKVKGCSVEWEQSVQLLQEKRGIRPSCSLFTGTDKPLTNIEIPTSLYRSVNLLHEAEAFLRS
jgi:hypothetical protein